MRITIDRESHSATQDIVSTQQPVFESPRKIYLYLKQCLTRFYVSDFSTSLQQRHYTTDDINSTSATSRSLSDLVEILYPSRVL
jgi:hypothetical protein